MPAAISGHGRLAGDWRACCGNTLCAESCGACGGTASTGRGFRLRFCGRLRPPASAMAGAGSGFAAWAAGAALISVAVRSIVVGRLEGAAFPGFPVLSCAMTSPAIERREHPTQNQAPDGHSILRIKRARQLWHRLRKTASPEGSANRSSMACSSGRAAMKIRDRADLRKRLRSALRQTEMPQFRGRLHDAAPLRAGDKNGGAAARVMQDAVDLRRLQGGDDLRAEFLRRAGAINHDRLQTQARRRQFRRHVARAIVAGEIQKRQRLVRDLPPPTSRARSPPSPCAETTWRNPARRAASAVCRPTAKQRNAVSASRSRMHRRCARAALPLVISNGRTRTGAESRVRKILDLEHRREAAAHVRAHAARSRCAPLPVSAASATGARISRP